MLEDLLLLSGAEIPFFSAKLNIQQPRVKDIAVIGEENFFIACQMLNFNKKNLPEEDKSHLVNASNFEILMLMINTPDFIKQRVSATMLLSLLFPNYIISFEESQIILKEFETDEEHIINSENYEEFKQILIKMFGLEVSEEDSLNPANRRAQEIADKLKKGREKTAQTKSEKNDKIAILSRYASILAIGLSLDINILLNYTVYQLYDMFKRFQLYQSFDINLRARMAGAEDLEEVENWMDDIHP